MLPTGAIPKGHIPEGHTAVNRALTIRAINRVNKAVWFLNTFQAVFDLKGGKI